MILSFLALTAPCLADNNLDELTDYLIGQKVPMGTAIDYASTILSSCKEYRVSWKWYTAILYRENQWKAKGTDGKGSFGISQMQVQTAKDVAIELGDNPSEITQEWEENHPLTMIRYGAKHFRDLLWEFRGPNRYYWATRAYNAGGTKIHLAINGSKKWKGLSEKYYWDINKKYTEISQYLTEDGRKN